MPYLRDLGITHCYASPYLKARPGSTHGYDIIDHGCLNPEIGTRGGLRRLGRRPARRTAWARSSTSCPTTWASSATRTPGGTTCWRTARRLRYAGYFDIAWQASPRPELQRQGPAAGPRRPVRQRPRGRPAPPGLRRRRLHDPLLRPPLPGRARTATRRSWRTGLDELERTLGAEAPALLEYQSILTAVSAPPRPHGDRIPPGSPSASARRRSSSAGWPRWPPKCDRGARTPSSRPWRCSTARRATRTASTCSDDLLDEQAYRLAYWRVASDEINYRRFFDINDLAALSMERPEVFEATHGLVLRLLAEGKVDGLRIDHPDGLYDPAQYFRRLQEHYVLALARTRPSRPDPVSRGRDWNELEGPAPRSASARPARTGPVRPAGAGRSTSSSRRSSAPSEPLPPRLGRSTAPAATTSSTRSTACSSTRPARSRSPGSTSDWIEDDPRFAELVYRKKLLILQVVAVQRAAHADPPARPPGAEEPLRRATSPSTACATPCAR